MEEFRKLYEEVYPDLYRMAYYYLGSAADAEDAVQDLSLIHIYSISGIWAALVRARR